MAIQVSRRPYRRVVSRTRWYFRHPRYLRYMAREVTAIFIAGYTVLQLVGLARLAESRAAYETFLQALQSPASIAFHVLALVFATYHSMTWFNLAPKAMPLQWGAMRMPHWVMAGAHYLAWTILSVGVLFCAGAI